VPPLLPLLNDSFRNSIINKAAVNSYALDSAILAIALGYHILLR
jgi:hypothetical protein